HEPDQADRADRAQRLLAFSREARWTFPSSMGRPVMKDPPAWASRFVEERASFAAAATFFVRRGDFASANELAASPAAHGSSPATTRKAERSSRASSTSI